MYIQASTDIVYTYNRYRGFVWVLENLKVLEFYCGIFEDWKFLEKGYWSSSKNVKRMADSKEN